MATICECATGKLCFYAIAHEKVQVRQTLLSKPYARSSIITLNIAIAQQTRPTNYNKLKNHFELYNRTPSNEEEVNQIEKPHTTSKGISLKHPQGGQLRHVIFDQ